MHAGGFVPTGIVGTVGTLRITGNAEADQLLDHDGTALLIGMLADQQVPMEWAFRAPATLADRLGGLDAGRIAAMDVEDFVAVCCAKPAIHRYPAAIGRRIHAMCEQLVEDYDGHGSNVWADVTSGDELSSRLAALPGFGAEKTMIFVAMLAKRFGVAPPGWEHAAGPFADSHPPIRRRHRRARLPRPRPGVEEGPEGRREDQAGVNPGPNPGFTPTTTVSPGPRFAGVRAHPSIDPSPRSSAPPS